MTLVLPKVIGHRGAPKQAPENTLASFAQAHRLGATWVELDVQLSRDLVPFVFHDGHLERTSNGQGILVERDSSYLAQLDVGSWFDPKFKDQRLPTFEQVLDLLIELSLGLNIEIKAEDDRAALTAIHGLEPALAQWPTGRQPPLVTSFSRNALAEAQKLAPKWPRGLVADKLPKDWKEVSARFQCSTLHLHHSAIDPQLVEEAGKIGLQILAFTVDDPAKADQLWSWGVASIFSDRPDQLLG